MKIITIFVYALFPSCLEVLSQNTFQINTGLHTIETVVLLSCHYCAVYGSTIVLPALTQACQQNVNKVKLRTQVKNRPLYHTKNMKQDITKMHDGKNYSFKAYQQSLNFRTEQEQILKDTATLLLEQTHTSPRQQSFKNKFFDTYCKKLAGNCGCSEVLPDHLRIDRKWEQLFIELTVAIFKICEMKDMPIKRIAKLLLCTLDSRYDLPGMINRIKNPLPEYEWIREAFDSKKALFKPENKSTRNKK